MKPITIAALTLFFSIVGCGQEKEPYPVDISMTEVVRITTADKDPYLLKTHDYVSDCLSKYGYSRSGFPTIIIVKDEFRCGNYMCRGFSDGVTIYMAEFYLYTWTIFAEETGHWITRRGDNYHADPFFVECSSYIPYYGYFPPPDPARH